MGLIEKDGISDEQGKEGCYDNEDGECIDPSSPLENREVKISRRIWVVKNVIRVGVFIPHVLRDRGSRKNRWWALFACRRSRYRIFGGRNTAGKASIISSVSSLTWMIL